MLTFNKASIEMINQGLSYTNLFEKDFTNYLNSLVKSKNEELSFVGEDFNNDWSKVDYKDIEFFLTALRYESNFARTWLRNTQLIHVKKVEGWKLHISISNEDEYKFLLTQFAPYLIENNIPSKFVHVDSFDLFFNHPLQKGKFLVIYSQDNLEFLKKLPEPLKQFLLSGSGKVLDVVTDMHVGGRVFARYSNYYDDPLVNPNTGEYIVMERLNRHEVGAKAYKPSWITELPSLETLLS